MGTPFTTITGWSWIDVRLGILASERTSIQDQITLYDDSNEPSDSNSENLDDKDFDDHNNFEIECMMMNDQDEIEDIDCIEDDCNDDGPYVKDEDVTLDAGYDVFDEVRDDPPGW